MINKTIYPRVAYSYTQTFVGRIDFNLLKNIELSIEKNNREIFNELAGFIVRTLVKSIEANSLTLFQKYIYLPFYYYLIGRKNPQISPLSTDKAARHLKELMITKLRFDAIDNFDTEKKEFLNNSSYFAYYSYNLLLVNMIHSFDSESLKQSVNQFNHVLPVFNNHDFYSLEREVNNINNDNEEEEKKEKINILVINYEVNNQYITYHRHVLCGLQFWLWQLFDQDKIDDRTLNQYTGYLNIAYTSDLLLYDLIFFRSCERNYLGWDDWDFEEHPEGETYTPLSPSLWLTFGFVVFHLRTESPIIRDLAVIERKEEFALILDDVTRYCDRIRNNFEKWNIVISCPTINDLDERIDRLKLAFTKLKRSFVGSIEKEIAEQSLSIEKIENFKQIVGTGWKNQSKVHSLFDHFQNKRIITDENSILNKLGENIFFEKAKMMFVEKHYQYIHGIENIGGQVGRLEDNVFFRSLINSKKTLNCVDIFRAIDEQIKNIKQNGFNVNLIVVPPELSYSNEEFFQHPDYTPSWKGQEINSELFNMGSYKDIPICSSFSRLISDKICICQFDEAFLLHQRVNEKWYDNQLEVKVSAVTNAEADQKLKENPDKWLQDRSGNKLSPQDALTLIKTSVIFDVWLSVEFIIKNPQAFSLVKFKGNED